MLNNLIIDAIFQASSKFKKRTILPLNKLNPQNQRRMLTNEEIETPFKSPLLMQ